MTQINKYSAELYAGLEKETGHPVGWKPVGRLIVARSKERLTHLRRTAAMSEWFGVEVHLINPEAAREKWPLLRIDDVLGAAWLPHDGKVIPQDAAVALAKGAQSHGARIIENVRVLDVLQRDGRAAGVRVRRDDSVAADVRKLHAMTNAERGTRNEDESLVTSAATVEIKADYVVLAGGMWTRELGLRCGVMIPLYPVEHHYVDTEPIDGAFDELPVGRDPDLCIYFRGEGDAVMLGAFQAFSKPWMVERVPDDFTFQLLEPDWEKFAEPLKNGKWRIPALETCRFAKFVNGPEGFTPDNNFIMGEAPELRNLFVAAGFNSVGIASAGGAGKYLAEWIVEGQPTMDLWSVDIRRFGPWANNRAFLRERVTEYSFGRQNWFANHAAEHRAAREKVAIFDQTGFSKFIFKGRDATNVLQRLCGNQVDVAVGKTVYTGLFNERGGFESDLTLVRLARDEFYIVSGTAQSVRDFDWIARNIHRDEHAGLLEVTAGFGVLGVMGPNARALLSRVTDAGLSNRSFPFGTAQQISIGFATVRAVRITYVGELGWELHVPMEQLALVYETLTEAGADLSLADAGHYAINSLRLEKGYRAWGAELSPDDTPLEAGLAFAIDWSKPFMGREALLKQKKAGVNRRLAIFILGNPEPMLWGGELIYRDSEPVGYTTSGSYGHTVGGAIATGY